MATTGRDSGRSSVKELFSTKAKCVVNPDFTLDHYNISGSVGNFDFAVLPHELHYNPDQKSLSFDGSSTNYVSITNSELDFTPDEDARSYSIWVKRASPSSIGELLSIVTYTPLVSLLSCQATSMVVLAAVALP